MILTSMWVRAHTTTHRWKCGHGVAATTALLLRKARLSCARSRCLSRITAPCAATNASAAAAAASAVASHPRTVAAAAAAASTAPQGMTTARKRLRLHVPRRATTAAK